MICALTYEESMRYSKMWKSKKFNIAYYLILDHKTKIKGHKCQTDRRTVGLSFDTYQKNIFK